MPAQVYTNTAPGQQVIVNRNPESDQQKTFVNYSNMNTTQDHTNTSYSFSQPTHTYVSNQPVTTYVSNQPVTTYASNQQVSAYGSNQQVSTYASNQQVSAYASNQQPTYVYQSGQNIIQNMPTTYTYAQPTTQYQYVQAEPTTFVQATPSYVQAEPTTYVQATPSYVQAEPVNYGQSTNTVYYQVDPSSYTYTQPTTTYVSQNVEGNVQADPKVYTQYTSMNQRKSYGQYVSTTEGVQGTRTYVNYVNNPEQVTKTELIQNQAPVSYVYNQPTTTYVQGAPVEYKSYSQAPTITYVQAEPSYVQGGQTITYGQPITSTSFSNVVSNGNPTSVVERKVSQANIQNGEHVTYQVINEPQYVQYTQMAEGTRVYSQTTPSNYIIGDQNGVISGGVEVRKGTSIPAPSEVRVIKKRYVVQGNELVEVPTEEELGVVQEQQHE